MTKKYVLNMFGSNDGQKREKKETNILQKNILKENIMNFQNMEDICVIQMKPNQEWHR